MKTRKTKLQRTQEMMTQATREQRDARSKPIYAEMAAVLRNIDKRIDDGSGTVHFTAEEHGALAALLARI